MSLRPFRVPRISRPSLRAGRGRQAAVAPCLLCVCLLGVCLLGVCLLGALLAVEPIAKAATRGGRGGLPAHAAHTQAATAGDQGRSPPASTLVVASFGGRLQAAQQAVLFRPYAARTGLPIMVEGWDGSLATLQRRARTGSEDWDLVMMEQATLQEACREGLFLSRPLTADPEATGLDSTGRDCGIDGWRTTLVLAWDQSRIDATPTWTDFWDVARRPGKRGLRRTPVGTLEIALLADGVAPDDLYRVLASREGVDRAFRKLDQLRPYLVWWNTPAEAVRTIESGAVLMTSAPGDEVAAANRAGHRSFGIQWSQSLGEMLGWAVPRAAQGGQRAHALDLLAYLAAPAQKAAFVAAYPPGATAPTRSAPGATVRTPAATARVLAGEGADRKPAAMIVDDGFWSQHLDQLDQRFQHWIASR